MCAGGCLSQSVGLGQDRKKALEFFLGHFFYLHFLTWFTPARRQRLFTIYRGKPIYGWSTVCTNDKQNLPIWDQHVPFVQFTLDCEYSLILVIVIIGQTRYTHARTCEISRRRDVRGAPKIIFGTPLRSRLLEISHACACVYLVRPIITITKIRDYSQSKFSLIYRECGTTIAVKSSWGKRN